MHLLTGKIDGGGGDGSGGVPRPPSSGTFLAVMSEGGVGVDGGGFHLQFVTLLWP